MVDHQKLITDLIDKTQDQNSKIDDLRKKIEEELRTLDEDDDDEDEK